MRGISIQLPAVDADEAVEIEVRVNGNKSTYQYRVEILDWESCESEEPEIRVRCLRKAIENKGEDWELVTIGAPSDSQVPIMFRKVDYGHK